MFRLQQAMKSADKDEVLLYIEQFFTEEEEKENVQKRKDREEAEQHLRSRKTTQF